jgi:hypothetical protein
LKKSTHARLLCQEKGKVPVVIENAASKRFFEKTFTEAKRLRQSDNLLEEHGWAGAKERICLPQLTHDIQRQK